MITNNIKLIGCTISIFFFFSIFIGCNKNQTVYNEFLTASIPKDYVILDNEEDDILCLCKTINGLQSLFLVDHMQENLLIPNFETIKEYSPISLLTSRLESIEEDTTDPEWNWQNFEIVSPPEPFTFKSYKAAQAVFSVDENINDTGKIVKRKIKRIIIFTDNDLWNFVLAPSDTTRYDEEIKVFEHILESMEIKKQKHEK